MGQIYCSLAVLRVKINRVSENQKLYLLFTLTMSTPCVLAEGREHLSEKFHSWLGVGHWTLRP